MTSALRFAATVVFLCAAAAAYADPRKVEVLDDCDPTDLSWNMVGGCVLDGGEVTFLEFVQAAPLGHPAWRNDPSYLKIKTDKRVKVVNRGGRAHTFTPVQDFGPGIVPEVNVSPVDLPVPECLSLFEETLIPPGAGLTIEGLAPGTHKYQCCFHPWMRAEIRVD